MRQWVAVDQRASRASSIHQPVTLGWLVWAEQSTSDLGTSWLWVRVRLGTSWYWVRVDLGTGWRWVRVELGTSWLGMSWFGYELTGKPIDDLYEVVPGLFKKPINGPLKFKMAEIRRLGSWRQNAKTLFSGKLSNSISCNWAFQSTHYWIPNVQDGWDPSSWKSTWRHFFLPRVVRFG